MNSFFFKLSFYQAGWSTKFHHIPRLLYLALGKLLHASAQEASIYSKENRDEVGMGREDKPRKHLIWFHWRLASVSCFLVSVFHSVLRKTTKYHGNISSSFTECWLLFHVFCFPFCFTEDNEKPRQHLIWFHWRLAVPASSYLLCAAVACWRDQKICKYANA